MSNVIVGFFSHLLIYINLTFTQSLNNSFFFTTTNTSLVPLCSHAIALHGSQTPSRSPTSPRLAKHVISIQTQKEKSSLYFVANGIVFTNQKLHDKVPIDFRMGIHAIYCKLFTTCLY